MQQNLCKRNIVVALVNDHYACGNTAKKPATLLKTTTSSCRPPRSKLQGNMAPIHHGVATQLSGVSWPRTYLHATPEYELSGTSRKHPVAAISNARPVLSQIPSVV